MDRRIKFILATTISAALVGGVVAAVGPDQILNKGIKMLVRGGFLLDTKNEDTENMLQNCHIAVLLADGVEDTEVTEPVRYLESKGAEVVYIGREIGEVTGKRGGKLETTHLLDQVEAVHYDGLLIPGGYAPDKLRQSEEVLNLVRDFHKLRRPIAAICHGPQVLISAGLLEGKTATGYGAIREELEEAGATYKDVAVVQERNLIMSRHPMDIPAFSRTFASALQK